MSYLINFFFFPLPHEKPVGAVDDDAVFSADILISVDDPFRDDDRSGRIFPYIISLMTGHLYFLET